MSVCTNPIPLIIESSSSCDTQLLESYAQQLSSEYGFNLNQPPATQGFELGLDEQGLKLYWRDEPKIKPIMVDYVAGANAHRRQFGGGRGQAIAKAVGLRQGANPSVIDGTAGLGKDAFVLASLGSKVTLVERHPVVRALLADGLKRAYDNPDIGPWMQTRMQLSDVTHISALTGNGHIADVVYLDPMYPHDEKAGKKSALVKKDMRLFQSLVGSDQDAADLLAPALEIAKRRVVVKRPDYASELDGQKPTYRFDMKKNRFDIYVAPS